MAEPRHTNPACVAQLLDAMVAIEAFRTLWPEHCISCKGRGVVPNMDLCREDECPLCLLADNCPRCRTVGMSPGPHPVCSQCGWSFGAGGEPEIPLCICNVGGVHG